ncbi:MAG: TetR/AcrR family transcriptional regulator [Clostridium sp.]|nr:TetR/AcrR family transcriptional regulator [Clostridium sp.]
MPKDTLLNLEEKKRNKIIRAAVMEFSNKGYDKGNVSEIAKEAGVSKGSMYQYFNNKKDIYLYCFEKAYEIYLRYFEDKTKKYEKMSIFDYMYLAFKMSWPFFVDKREMYIFIQNAYFDINSEVHSEVIKIAYRESKPYLKMLTEMIDMNKEKGLIKTKISTDLILMYLEAILSKFKEKMKIIAKENGKEAYDMPFEEFDTLIKDMISLIKNGIG